MAARKKSKLDQVQFQPIKPYNYRNIKISIALAVILFGFFWFFWYQPSVRPNPTDLSRSSQPSVSSQTNQMHSSDGTMTLKMKSEKRPQGLNVYTFFVLTNSTQMEKQLFSKTVAAGSSIILPANCWSPDNKAVFIKETGPGKLTFLVFKASGETFSGGETYYDIGSLFAQKLPKYILTDATGWASGTLVIIKTNTEDGTKGPSFWFDLTSQSFLQLSR